MNILFNDELILKTLTWLDSQEPLNDQAILRQTQFLLLDTLGCVNAAFLSSTIKELEVQFSTFDAGPHAINHGPSMSALSIAQLFAYAACWHEACEGHASAHGRPGVATIAAIYPFAKNLKYRQFLKAIVYGYEISVRFAQMLRIKPGMHVDGNWPCIGAAVAVGKCLNLSNEQLVKAINIACTQLPMSLYIPITKGANSRNSYLGHAAVLGIQSALSASTSIEAPGSAVIEYANVALGNKSPQWIDTENFEILNAYIKPFASVRHVHYGAIAAMSLRSRVDISQIKEIELEIYEEATIYCSNRSPKTAIQAQFSLTFGLVAALVLNHLNFEIYTEEFLFDKKINHLENLVNVKINKELTENGKRGAKVSILDHSGWHHSEVSSILGDSENPMDENQIRDKFMHNSKQTIGESMSKTLYENILTSDLDQSVSKVLY